MRILRLKYFATPLSEVLVTNGHKKSLKNFYQFKVLAANKRQERENQKAIKKIFKKDKTKLIDRRTLNDPVERSIAKEGEKILYNNQKYNGSITNPNSVYSQLAKNEYKINRSFAGSKHMGVGKARPKKSGGLLSRLSDYKDALTEAPIKYVPSQKTKSLKNFYSLEEKALRHRQQELVNRIKNISQTNKDRAIELSHRSHEISRRLDAIKNYL